MADESATATAPKADKAKTEGKPAPKVKLTSGKMATGPVVEITCKAKGCTKKRTIKKQDQFQVKYCLEHQKENRNKLRRERRKEKSKTKGKGKTAKASNGKGKGKTAAPAKA